MRVRVAVYDAPNGKNYNIQKCRIILFIHFCRQIDGGAQVILEGQRKVRGIDLDLKLQGGMILNAHKTAHERFKIDSGSQFDYRQV